MIGKKIAEIRKHQKITIQEMSDSINVSTASLSMYENGKRIPSIHNLKKIAEFLNIELSELYINQAEDFKYLQEKMNDSIISQTLERANGFCELCRYPAPFITNDGMPFLIVCEIESPLENNYKHFFSLCPNCNAKIQHLNLIGDRIYLFNSM